MELIAIFKMWSAWHFLFIFSPFIIMAFLYEILKNKSEKTKYIVGVIIGTMCLVIMGVRNINLVITQGFTHEVIPLQICHIGNFVVFIACVFRSKIATSMAFVFHLICAMFSLIFADALEAFNWGNGVFEITAMAYIFGHIFIILGSIYPVLMKLVKFDFKDFWIGMGVIYSFASLAIILNPYFNNVLNDQTNFFFLFNSKGIPCEWLYLPSLTLHYGWFEINFLYVGVLIAFFTLLAIGFYFLQRLWYKNEPSYITYNIFEAKKIKHINTSLVETIELNVHEEVKETKVPKLKIISKNKTYNIQNNYTKLK